jgi:hypothetical protein
LIAARSQRAGVLTGARVISFGVRAFECSLVFV